MSHLENMNIYLEVQEIQANQHLLDLQLDHYDQEDLLYQEGPQTPPDPSPLKHADKSK